MFTPAMVDDALRFMAVPPSGRSEELRQLVRRAAEKLESIAAVRQVWRRFPLELRQDGITLEGLSIASRDLARLFARCRSCYLLASTLGFEVDRAIALAQRVDMVEGLALDACASVWADAVCDSAEVQIAQELSPGEHLTMRFSPGYGDVALEASAGLLELLDARRRIGLTMTKGAMLTPVKSVTALIGVSWQSEDRRRNCARCGAVMNCRYRKGGDRCGL